MSEKGDIFAYFHRPTMEDFIKKATDEHVRSSVGPNGSDVMCRPETTNLIEQFVKGTLDSRTFWQRSIASAGSNNDVKRTEAEIKNKIQELEQRVMALEQENQQLQHSGREVQVDLELKSTLKWIDSLRLLISYKFK